ncbi:MAG: RebB family R body protein [Planctomycetota bacterium]
MADPEQGVSPKITDSVAQTNVKVLAEAPAFAMASLYQTSSNATGLSINNATTVQGLAQIIALVATVKGSIDIITAK